MASQSDRLLAIESRLTEIEKNEAGTAAVVSRLGADVQGLRDKTHKLTESAAATARNATEIATLENELSELRLSYETARARVYGALALVGVLAPILTGLLAAWLAKHVGL